MGKIKAVIFDMDGVIFDTERARYNCWLKVAKHHNLDDAENVYIKLIGVNKAREKEIFFECYGPSYPYEQIQTERKEEYQKTYSNGRLPIKEGAVELLSTLKKENLPIAIASSSDKAVIETLLKDANIRRFFDVIIGGDMISHSKPDPEIFLKAIAALKFAPKECIVIEDSYNGIRAAYAAGANPVMVPDMLPPSDEMREKAAAILPCLTEVWDFINK